MISHLHVIDNKNSGRVQNNELWTN